MAAHGLILNRRQRKWQPDISINQKSAESFYYISHDVLASEFIQTHTHKA